MEFPNHLIDEEFLTGMYEYVIQVRTSQSLSTSDYILLDLSIPMEIYLSICLSIYPLIDRSYMFLSHFISSYLILSHLISSYLILSRLISSYLPSVLQKLGYCITWHSPKQWLADGNLTASMDEHGDLSSNK